MNIELRKSLFSEFCRIGFAVLANPLWMKVGDDLILLDERQVFPQRSARRVAVGDGTAPACAAAATFADFFG